MSCLGVREPSSRFCGFNFADTAKSGSPTAALQKTNHLYIGICTPEICTPEVAQTTGFPCTQALNPFSFEERAEMLTAALDDEGINRNSYTCIPFPSDYKNLEKFLVPGTVFLMSVTGPGDKQKIDYIHSLGYKTKTIMDIPEDAPRERSGTVRDTAHTEVRHWEDIVPKAVSDYIKRPEITDRLRKLGIPTDVIQ